MLVSSSWASFRFLVMLVSWKILVSTALLPTLLFCPYPSLFIAQNIIIFKKQGQNLKLRHILCMAYKRNWKKKEENIKYQHILLVHWIWIDLPHFFRCCYFALHFHLMQHGGEKKIRQNKINSLPTYPIFFYHVIGNENIFCLGLMVCSITDLQRNILWLAFYCPLSFSCHRV